MVSQWLSINFAKMPSTYINQIQDYISLYLSSLCNFVKGNPKLPLCKNASFLYVQILPWQLVGQEHLCILNSEYNLKHHSNQRQQFHKLLCGWDQVQKTMSTEYLNSLPDDNVIFMPEFLIQNLFVLYGLHSECSPWITKLLNKWVNGKQNILRKPNHQRTQFRKTFQCLYTFWSKHNVIFP